MSDIGSAIMSILAGLPGLLGLFLASRAADAGFYLFGLALAGFAIIYIFTMIKLAYDRARALGAALVPLAFDTIEDGVLGRAAA
jgi:hypothetical protein